MTRKSVPSWCPMSCSVQMWGWLRLEIAFACAKRGVASNVSREHFDRNRSAQPRVGRLIDFAHSTGSDTLDDFVRAEPGWNQRHLWGEL